MDNYTAYQIGPASVRPITRRTVDQYSVVLIQPGNNDQITVLEPCSWQAGKDCVQGMIERGIDPADIRCVWRPDRSIADTDGLPLRSISAALWDR